MHTLYTCTFARYGQEDFPKQGGIFTRKQIKEAFKNAYSIFFFEDKYTGEIEVHYDSTVYKYTPTDSEGERAFRYWNLGDSEKEFETEYTVK